MCAASVDDELTMAQNVGNQDPDIASTYPLPGKPTEQPSTELPTTQAPATDKPQGDALEGIQGVLEEIRDALKELAEGEKQAPYHDRRVTKSHKELAKGKGQAPYHDRHVNKSHKSHGQDACDTKHICTKICAVRHQIPKDCVQHCQTGTSELLNIVQVYCTRGLCSELVSGEEVGLLQDRRMAARDARTFAPCRTVDKYCQLLCRRGLKLPPDGTMGYQKCKKESRFCSSRCSLLVFYQFMELHRGDSCDSVIRNLGLQSKLRALSSRAAGNCGRKLLCKASPVLRPNGQEAQMQMLHQHKSAAKPA